MKDRGLKKYDLVDMTSFAKDGSIRHVRGYRAIPYNLPRGCAIGYIRRDQTVEVGGSEGGRVMDGYISGKRSNMSTEPNKEEGNRSCTNYIEKPILVKKEEVPYQA